MEFRLHQQRVTILYLLGLDHMNLTFPTSGRDIRIIDVPTGFVCKILA